MIKIAVVDDDALVWAIITEYGAKIFNRERYENRMESQFHRCHEKSEETKRMATATLIMGY
jgi:hypothetical protein